MNNYSRFSEEPVKIIPFDPLTKIAAKKLIAEISVLLEQFRPQIKLRGSTSFEISGKGDIEIGVFPNEDDWQAVIDKLTQKYGDAGNTEEEYVRLKTVSNGFEVEIIVMKGETASKDLKLHEYLKANPILLEEYELIKLNFSFSKREYQKQKDAFFAKMLKIIQSHN